MSKSRVVELDLGQIQVPANYLPGKGSALVVNFHGALNRETRTIPFFMPFFPGLSEAHQLSIPDPALERYADLASSWYLGWKGVELWTSLGHAIRQFADRVGCVFRVYVGGSSGGFAALLYSHQDKGSVVVCYNPQTDLVCHVYERATRVYLRKAWSIESDDATALSKIPLRLQSLYTSGFSNTIVYLQSAADPDHLYRQALPFLSALPLDKSDDIVVDIGFNGVRGHTGSIRRDAVLIAVKAALAAERVDKGRAEIILDAKHAVEIATHRPEAPTSSDKRVYADEDLRLADRLANIELRS